MAIETIKTWLHGHDYSPYLAIPIFKDMSIWLHGLPCLNVNRFGRLKVLCHERKPVVENEAIDAYPVLNSGSFDFYRQRHRWFHNLFMQFRQTFGTLENIGGDFGQVAGEEVCLLFGKRLQCSCIFWDSRQCFERLRTPCPNRNSLCTGGQSSPIESSLASYLCGKSMPSTSLSPVTSCHI